MTPMVFCASLPPCAKLNIAAETNCTRPNQRDVLLGSIDCVTRLIIHINNNPIVIPNNGDNKMAIITLLKPVNSKTCNPPFARAAPTNPPIKACEELDGNPKYQVPRFQMMAPINAEKT